MSRWWRAYDEALDDPKLQKLGLEMIGAWFNLLCMASRNNGAIRISDVPFSLRVPKAKAAEIVTRLATAGLLDRKGDDYEPHKWSDRQFKSDGSTERVKRFRNGKRNVSCNVSETETKQDQIQSRAEQKKEIYSAGAKIRPEAFSISDDCYRILGIELEAIPLEWCGLTYQIEMMLTRGYDPPGILATAAKLSGHKPLKPMNYFVKCVESSQQNQIKPAGQSDGKSGNVVQAADRLIAKLAYFDEPAPQSAGICGGTGETPLRAISEG